MPTGVYKRTKEHNKNVSKALTGNKNNYKHGEGRTGKGTRLYIIWLNMKTRCYNPKGCAYEHYGGRGIKVCDEWRNSFIVFRDFALSHGYKDNLTIDRIDNDGNYESSNVQFITLAENSGKDSKGKIVSEETKRKISKTLTGKKYNIQEI